MAYYNTMMTTPMAGAVDNSATNVMNVINSMQGLVQYYLQAGQMMPQEANSILAAINTSQSQQTIAGRVRGTYGYTLMGQGELQNFANDFIQRALSKLRTRSFGTPMINVPPMSVGNAQAPIGFGGYTNAAAQDGGILGADSLYSDISSDNIDATMSGTPQQVRSNTVTHAGPPPSQSCTVNLVPDNSVPNTYEYREDILPNLTEMKLPAPRDPDAFKAYGYTVGKREMLTLGSDNIYVMEINLNDPYSNRINMIQDVIGMTAASSDIIYTDAMFPHLATTPDISIMDESDNNTTEDNKSNESPEKRLPLSAIPRQIILDVNWSQLRILNTSYKTGSETLSAIATIAQSNKGEALDTIMSKLTTNGPEFDTPILNELLSEFNHAASVCFMKSIPNSSAMDVIDKIRTIPEFKDLYSNSGKFEEWKKPHTDTFNKRLSSCFKVSIGRLFSKIRKLYLDPSMASDFSQMMTSELFTARIRGIVGRTYAMTTHNENADKFFKNKAFSVFPWLISRKVILHNIDLPELVTSRKAGQSAIVDIHDPSSVVLYKLYNNIGPFICIDLRKQEDWITPLIVGVSYENQVVARRIIV